MENTTKQVQPANPTPIPDWNPVPIIHSCTPKGYQVPVVSRQVAVEIYQDQLQWRDKYGCAPKHKCTAIRDMKVPYAWLEDHNHAETARRLFMLDATLETWYKMCHCKMDAKDWKAAEVATEVYVPLTVLQDVKYAHDCEDSPDSEYVLKYALDSSKDCYLCMETNIRDNRLEETMEQMSQEALDDLEQEQTVILNANPHYVPVGLCCNGCSLTKWAADMPKEVFPCQHLDNLCHQHGVSWAYSAWTSAFGVESARYRATFLYQLMHLRAVMDAHFYEELQLSRFEKGKEE